MKVPVFEEIELGSIEEKVLKSKLKKHKAGSMPLYIDCEGMTQVDFDNFTTTLKKCMDNINLHPIYPYPVYLIHSEITKSEDFLILKNEDELPKFYRQKSARLKNKEQLLLAKVELYAERIRNRNVESDLNFIEERSITQKDLYRENKKESFLLKVQEQLAKAIREEM